MKMKIGICGAGWVGGTMIRYLTEVKGYVKGDNLAVFDLDPAKCAGDISDADIVFVCVPTPMGADGSCVTNYVRDAVERVAVGKRKAIVIKSTVPPGTTDNLQEQYPGHALLFNPEFLTECRAWEDMLRPDRQIVGFTDKSLDAAHEVLALLPKATFMSPWGVGTYKQIRITATEAELIKYAGNVYFARKVSFANAIAKIAEKVGADYENIRMALGAEYRIGESHLDVSHGGYKGFGGSCLPKDLSALKEFAREQHLYDVSDLFQEDWLFNEKLLREQGLSVQDVMGHFGDFKKKV